MAITRAQQVRQMLEKGGGADRIPTEFEKFLFQKQLQLLQEFENYKDRKPIEKRQNEFFEMRTGTGKGPTLEAKEGGSIRQMLEDGGMLVQPSMTGKRPGYRSEKTQSSKEASGKKGPGNTGQDSQSESDSQPDRRDADDLKAAYTRDLYRTKGPPEDVRKGRDDDFISKQKEIEKKLKQGNFKIKDVIEGLTSFNRRNLYNLTKSFNNPSTEFSYIANLKYNNPTAYNQLSPELRAKYEETEDAANEFASYKDYDPFSFEEFEELRNLDDNQGGLAEYAATYKGQPGLKYAGNVGGLQTIVNVDPITGIKTYSYKYKDDGGGQGNLGEVPYYLRNQQPGDGGDTGDDGSNDNQFDFSRLLAEGGMPMDAPYVGGGIMDAAGRQQYFLGKLVKSAKKAVKGVTRSLKKVAKSPLGKAALAFGAYQLGSPLFGKGTFFGTGFNPLKDATAIGPMSSGLGKLLSKVGLTNFATGDLTLAGKIGLGFGIPAALSLFNQPEEEDEDIYRGPDIDFQKIINDPYAYSLPRQMAEGGRIGYSDGTIEGGAMMSKEEMKKLAKSPLYKGFKKMYGIDPSMAKENTAYDEKFSQFEELFKKGFQEGGDVEPVAKKTMPLLDMDGKEMDLRAEGGFVPIGRMEKADDVPARLSKNEFVFTADAVRNAGEGDVDKGAEVMYNMMKNLESGGDVSEESQGLSGAREMFQTSKRLEEVL